MGISKALVAASAALLGASSLALAADLPPPPPPMEFAPPPEPVAFSGWYLRGDVGVGASESTDIKSSFESGFQVPDARFEQSSIADSAFLAAGIGYQYNSWLRFDITGEYRTEQSITSIQSYDCSAFGCGGRAYDKYSGNVQSVVALFNAYADLGTWYGLTPFIGGSIGGSFNHIGSFIDVGVNGPNNFGVGGFGYSGARWDTSLAWAATAGVSYSITPTLKLELAYRYLDRGDIKTGGITCLNTPTCGNEVQKIHLASQDVKLGMRWMFTDVAPPPPPYMPPLVRKD